MAGDCAAAWMSPDEYLLILPYGDTGAAMATLAEGAGGASIIWRRWFRMPARCSGSRATRPIR